MAKKTAAPRRKYSRKPKNMKPSSSFKKMVKSVISADVETKMAHYASSTSSLTSFNSGINSTGDYLRLVPVITNGLEANQKIGDQVKAQALNVQGYVRAVSNPNSNTAQNLPQMVVRIFCVSLKEKSAWNNITSSTTPLTSLLDKGGTTTAWTGILSDIYAPVNRNIFTVHGDKLYYLSQNQMTGQTDATDPVIATDVREAIRFFKFNIKCKDKLLRYDSIIESGSTPTNFNPFLLVGYAYLSGDSPDTITTNLGVHYTSMLKYEDA